MLQNDAKEKFTETLKRKKLSGHLQIEMLETQHVDVRSIKNYNKAKVTRKTRILSLTPIRRGLLLLHHLEENLQQDVHLL